MLKQVLSVIVLIFLPVLLSAQQKDSLFAKQGDSILLKKRDSVLIRQGDSVLVKQVDSVLIKQDSLKNSIQTYQTSVKTILRENKFLNSAGKPFAMVTYPRKQSLQDTIFYTILTVIAILAFFRFFYVRYFNNLFRVFFNSSLRQSQLTDQLLQAKLPSLVFNVIFVASGGLFIYFLLKYLGWITEGQPLTLIFTCTLCLAAIYLLKFITLKFTGWVTGYTEVTDIYIFIIFLINKILGILLLPFIIVMAFSAPDLIKVSVSIAILLTAVMFLLRFFRSYGLLQHQLKISGLHFFMYIIGVEILPVLLIYKGLILLLSKNI